MRRRKREDDDEQREKEWVSEWVRESEWEREGGELEGARASQKTRDHERARARLKMRLNERERERVRKSKNPSANNRIPSNRASMFGQMSPITEFKIAYFQWTSEVTEFVNNIRLINRLIKAWDWHFFQEFYMICLTGVLEMVLQHRFLRCIASLSVGPSIGPSGGPSVGPSISPCVRPSVLRRSVMPSLRPARRILCRVFGLVLESESWATVFSSLWKA